MSFQISIKPSRRAAGRFVSRVRRTLQRAVVEEGKRKGLTQSDIARSIEVHRSVISRELNGRSDITLGRVGEIAWALGREISFELVEPESNFRQNTRPPVAGAKAAWGSVSQHSGVTSETVHVFGNDEFKEKEVAVV